MILQQIILVFAAYFIGSIPFSFIVGIVNKVNLLTVGSKNAGATNVYRVLGLKWALPAFLLDVAKGFLAATLAYYVFPANHLLIVGCGIASIVGHTFTPFLKFKGGKGVATGLGVLLFLVPVAALSAFVLGVTLILITRYVSVGSIAASVLAMVLSWVPLLHTPHSYSICVTLSACYIIYKHKANISRLLQGKENRI